MNAADMRNLDARIRALENVVGRLPVRSGSSAGGAGSGGTGGQVWITVDTYEELPDPDPLLFTLFAKILNGDFAGGIAYIYDDGGGREWHMLTHLE